MSNRAAGANLMSLTGKPSRSRGARTSTGRGLRTRATTGPTDSALRTPVASTLHRLELAYWVPDSASTYDGIEVDFEEIVAARFVCDGSKTADCHIYPSCGCSPDQWDHDHHAQGGEHAPVAHDTCWMTSWYYTMPSDPEYVDAYGPDAWLLDTLWHGPDDNPAAPWPNTDDGRVNVDAADWSRYLHPGPVHLAFTPEGHVAWAYATDSDSRTA